MRRPFIALIVGMSASALGCAALAQGASDPNAPGAQQTLKIIDGSTGSKSTEQPSGSDAAAAEKTRPYLYSSGDLISAKLNGAMAPNELGGTTTETSSDVDIDVDGAIKRGIQDPMKDVGDKTIAAGDQALRAKGFEGGLAGQGIDTSQIKTATTFDGIMPQVASAMVKDVMSQATTSLK